jgi:hypothetical protein
MKTRTRFLLTLALLLAGGSSISFAQVTGDPATDAGWGSSLGLSSASPLLLYETGTFSVNVYTTAFDLTAGSPLLGTLGTADGWNIGDTIVGVGGVFAPTGNSSVTYDLGNNTVTTRFVIKYGTSAETWFAGSSAGAAAALGGTGTIELGTSTEVLSATSGFQTPTNTPEEITGPSSTAAINDDVAQIITSWNGSGPGTIVGFEEYLDLTLLQSQVPTEDVALGDDFVLDLQQGSGVLQDSLGTLPVAVPEPTTLALLTAGLMLPFGAKTLRTLRKK